MTEDRTILERVLRLRDEQRRRRASERAIVTEQDAVLEDNAHARMRWYLHPLIAGNCINSMIVYRYELPPRSATGRVRAQGNIVSFVVKGYGRTIVNDVEHVWQEGDVIGLPPLLEGVVYQHINDSDEEALLITAEPNLLDAFGVDMGAGFEVLETVEEANGA